MQWLTYLFTVIPLSIHQDTVGPLARSITDAVLLLSIIAGKDLTDNFTLSLPRLHSRSHQRRFQEQTNRRPSSRLFWHIRFRVRPIRKSRIRKSAGCYSELGRSSRRSRRYSFRRRDSSRWRSVDVDFKVSLSAIIMRLTLMLFVNLVSTEQLVRISSQ